MTEVPADEYGLDKARDRMTVRAPDLPYRPRDPADRKVGIALIGCGGIAEQHLKAYSAANYDVRMLCDVDLDRAEERQRLFAPQASITTSAAEVFARDDVQVVDLATHPRERAALIRAALEADKHVLSQKPLALDLDEAADLVALAERRGRRLAVNQNGRFAPHFAWMREAVRADLIGPVVSTDFLVHWDHEWVVGTPFDRLQHLILYDFAIHWFDMACTLFAPRRAQSVRASAHFAHGQRSAQPLLAEAQVEFEEGRATFAFHGASHHHRLDQSVVAGRDGTLHSIGPDLQRQSLLFTTAEGRARPTLEGAWYCDGFHGAMAELLCALEEDREPTHSARDNLHSLELCFAACASSLEHGAPVKVGSVRKLMGST